MLLSPEIWLSTNWSRVCAFAFGKAASAWSRAFAFAAFSPPRICTNE